MQVYKYDSDKSAGYAEKYALSPNPKYYYYDSLGGDCTNFCSQCLFEGCPQMNYLKTFGWYYIDANNKAPAWSAVAPFYNFITSNNSSGPFGRETTLPQIRKGDFIQISFDGEVFAHNSIVTKLVYPPLPQNVYICCHTANRLNFPLSEFPYRKIRCLHIEGWRK